MEGLESRREPVVNGLAIQEGDGKAERSFDLGKGPAFQVSSPLAQGKRGGGDYHQVGRGIFAKVFPDRFDKVLDHQEVPHADVPAKIAVLRDLDLNLDAAE